MNDFIQNCLIKLKQKNFYYPEIELRAILKYTTKKKKDILFSNFDKSAINIDLFNNIFNRRIKREPLSKIIRKKEFYSLNFFVNNDVLDPRPETEIIIEIVKKYFQNRDKNFYICDLGTGSGCLSIVLAKTYQFSNVVATDISSTAIKVARKNALKHNVSKKNKFC